MKFWLAAAGFGCLALVAGRSRAEQAYSDAVDEGFETIFNGVDLSGWTGDTAIYGVDPKEPGVLQCFPGRKSNGSGGNLVTEKEYGRNSIAGVIKSYFNDSYLSAVSSFVKEEKISVEELKELIKQIEQND